MKKRTAHIQVRIRWMIRRDMTDVLEIENGSFEFAWSEDDFIRCLRKRNCIGMVAVHDDQVVGFMVYGLEKTKLHILKFAVSKQFRRLGVGRQMVATLVGKLSTGRRNRIALEVRETNLSVQMFFRENGFQATQLLKGFYEDSPEYACLMQYRYREGQGFVAVEGDV
jgi:[ribosomal protein S18]-alanine N-acetyltransferase